MDRYAEDYPRLAAVQGLTLQLCEMWLDLVDEASKSLTLERLDEFFD